MGVSDLSLVTTNDLIDEMLNRFDHAVFMGIKALDIVNKEDDTTRISSFRNWKGNSYTCAGLAQSLMRASLADFEDKEEVYDE